MFENITPQVIVSGLQSPEGPSFSRQGILYFVDWDAQVVYQVSPTGELSVFVNTGGIPAGTKFHQDGDLYVADSGLRQIIRVTPEREIHVAASTWEGKAFRGPNDLTFASNGDIYFTDPRDSGPNDPNGAVYILRADGSVEQFAAGFQFPNGIILSRDEKTLFLAETFPKHILAFELDEDGHERSRRVFATLEGGLGPDGMAFGQDDNLYVAHFGKGVVAVIDPAGKVIGEIPVGGEKPTNVAFWEDSIYVTDVDKHQIVRLQIGVVGRPVFGLS